jgi:hypothetical protein
MSDLFYKKKGYESLFLFYLKLFFLVIKIYLFHQINDGFKCLWMIHCEVGEGFTI